jgi:Zn-dependent protease with chaperone function
MNRNRSVLALMLALSLTAAMAQAQTQVKPGWNLFSPQQDVEIGQQSSVEAERQLPILRDRDVDNYINRIGQQLAQNAGGPQFQYRFRVVNASDINAFALPGGYIYLNRGVIENSRNEGEVAGVIAHEIAHVALRHGTHQASKAYAAQAGLQILGGLLGGRVGGNTAQILNTVGGIGLNALFLKYSRDLETQADIRGAQILAASGYTPADMVSFFRQLENVDHSKKTTWLSDHPAPPDRIARIEKERQLLREPATPTQNVAQLNNIKSELRGHGRAPTLGEIAQGARPEGPMTSSSTVNVEPPSRTWRTYRDSNGLFSVAYPSNWRVYENGEGVTIAPEGGIGNVGNRTEIVYGILVDHFEAQNRSLRTATEELLQQMERTSPHLSVIRGSGQQFNLDGRTAMAASLRGRNPNTGITERVTVVTRQLPDAHLIYMVFVTPDQEASNYASVLNNVVRSIQIDERAH